MHLLCSESSANEENIWVMASGLLTKSNNTAHFILSVAKDLAFPNTLGPTLLASHVSLFFLLLSLSNHAALFQERA